MTSMVGLDVGAQLSHPEAKSLTILMIAVRADLREVK